MKVIEHKMLSAFNAGKELRSGADVIKSCNRHLIYRLYETDIIDKGPSNTIVIQTGGWETRTTISRLNSFFKFNDISARVFTSKKQLKLTLPNGKTIDWDGGPIDVLRVY